jgi:TonB family protein
MALAGSIVLHASLLASGAWLLSRSLHEPARPQLPAAVRTLSIDVEYELALPEIAAAGVQGTEPTALPPPLESQPGGRHLPRPDLDRAGRGGEISSREPATNLSSSIDPISLERDPATARQRNQTARLRTARQRSSLDDRRATPAPMELTFLATGPGRVRARRPYSESDPARGFRDGGVASVQGGRLGGLTPPADGHGSEAAPGGDVAGSPTPRIGRGTADGSMVADFNNGARVLLARPLVPSARPAVPSATRDRPNDTLDSSQEVAARVSALLQASSAGGPPGPGVGGVAGGSVPGVLGRAGLGSRSSASGAGYGENFSDEPGYSGYSRSLLAKLSKVLAGTFPEWAIEQGRGGHVIFELTLRADGSPSGVRLVRPSGIDDYDRNVLVAVRGTASFGRLPASMGAPALFRVSWDALNPVIGRSGSGPGGRHRQ